MNQTILEVKNLTYEFHTQDGIVKAVNGISYSLHEGETVAIVGESGSGKSVSAMALLQLLPQPPGKLVVGEALLNQKDVLKMDENQIRKVRGKHISIIFQDPMTSLNPVLRISRQMTEALEFHLKMTPNQAEKRAVEMLEMVGIPDAAKRVRDYPHQFSGGMRQRVMIAMALACNPDILIADEPTTALDVTIQAQIVRLVKQLREEMDMAIIWISHDLGVVAGMADNVIVMYSGYIVEKANVMDLYQKPAHPYTIGLLGSLPGANFQATKLVSIEGMPPDLTELPQGCPFAPRCAYRIERCFIERPELLPIADQHERACWVDVYQGSTT